MKTMGQSLASIQHLEYSLDKAYYDGHEYLVDRYRRRP